MIKILNDNGRLLCMMVATMASGVLSNPIRVERNEPQMEPLYQMAQEFIRMALTFPELFEEE